MGAVTNGYTNRSIPKDVVLTKTQIAIQISRTELPKLSAGRVYAAGPRVKEYTAVNKKTN